jgi:hypothetical protein
VDYTEQQIQELAKVKLEKFLDPKGVRSDLLEQYQRTALELPNYAFEDTTLFESSRGPLRFLRKLLHPLLKLFFNPNPLIHALHIQSRLNTVHAERGALTYEIIHNLVLETTRMSIEVKNLKMQIEALTSRLEFNERRARALESVVIYKPSAESGGERAVPPMPDPVVERDEAEPAGVPESATTQEGPGQRSRRRRRRRGRRGSGSAAAIMDSASPEGEGSPTGDTADTEALMAGDAGLDDESREAEDVEVSVVTIEDVESPTDDVNVTDVTVDVADLTDVDQTDPADADDRHTTDSES